MSSTPSRLGDFEIVEEIGRGGFGIVYRARQVSLDRPVAVKVLFRHLTGTEEQVSRFEREARAAARLEEVERAVATQPEVAERLARLEEQLAEARRALNRIEERLER